MKTGLFCIIMLASLATMAQRDSLPYASFPPALTGHYMLAPLVPRLLDGLGFPVLLVLRKGCVR